jgi:tRNA dimethylallyltransferase
VIALVGPTAVGKTEVSIELARRLGAEIIGCDSMQVYRGMAALTDQPIAAQRAAIPHHVIDCVDPGEAFSVAQYRERAARAIAEIHGRGRPALIVGGTGMYLRALRRGLCDAPAGEASVREQMLREAESDQGRALFERLRALDPDAADRITPGNTRRVVRALEVLELTGRPLSSFWRDQTASELSVRVVGLTRRRAQVYHRINRRVERMLADPAVLEEARRLGGQPLSRTAMQVHGLRFISAYVQDALSRAQAISTWQQQVRNYAKRQWTWFRAEPEILWIEPPDDEPTGTIAGKIMKQLQGV